MKKFFASMTALAIVGAMMVPFTAFADTDISNEGNTTRPVSFDAPGASWTITIPSAVDTALTAGTTYTITASNVDIDAGANLYITARSNSSSTGEWIVTNGSGDSLTYTTYQVCTYDTNGDPTPIDSGGTIASFNANGSASFEVVAPDSYPVHGATYTDTITFAVTTTDPNSTP